MEGVEEKERVGEDFGPRNKTLTIQMGHPILNGSDPDHKLQAIGRFVRSYVQTLLLPHSHFEFIFPTFRRGERKKKIKKKTKKKNKIISSFTRRCTYSNVFLSFVRVFSLAMLSNLSLGVASINISRCLCQES